MIQNGNCCLGDLVWQVVNNGVKATYPGEATCNQNELEIPGIDGTYVALQFHIHTSSEHTVGGKRFGAELHIVHYSEEQGRYAVVGMLIDPSSPTDNPLFGKIMSEFQAAAAKTAEACETYLDPFVGEAVEQPEVLCGADTFNIYDLLPTNATFYQYDGGLTTPPCSEVVWWNLAAEPVMISVAQYYHFVSLTFSYRDGSTCKPATIASPSGSTSRPTQPLNGRMVQRICPVDSYVAPSGKGGH